MAVKGNTGQPAPQTNTEKKKFEKKLYVGVAECKVVGINMSKEQMQALGWKVEKDPEYIDTKDDNDTVTISVVLKEVSTGAYLTARFLPIVDKNRAKSSTGKNQYLNNLGWESWAESEEKLPAAFAGKEPRIAKEGEASVYNFLRKWLNFKEDDAELKLNLNKLFRGNFKELHEVVDQFKDQKVTVLATVNSYTKNGGIVRVQNVYIGDFLPAEIWNKRTVEFFNNLEEKHPRDVDYFVANVTKERFGCRDYYELTPFKEYKSESSEPEAVNNETSSDDELPF